jgi:predicted dehydrogenase
MKIGIIGTGSMGKNHVRVVDSIDELDLVSVMDSNKQTLEDVKKNYPNVSVYDDYRKLTDGVDAVMVSTPTIFHYEIAKYFLKNNKNVLIEKPIAETVEQAEELTKLAKEKNLVLGVGHLERFNPAVEYVNKNVKSPMFIEIQRLGSFSPRSLDIDVIMDLMIHDLDIVLNWDKSGLKQVNASGIPIISKKIDIANVRLEFNSGLVANITASRVSQSKTRKLRIFQKSGYFSVDYQKKTVKTYGIKDGNIYEILPEINNVEPLYNLWKNFYKTITTKTNYNVTAEDATKALKLAKEIAEKIKNK